MMMTTEKEKAFLEQSKRQMEEWDKLFRAAVTRLCGSSDVSDWRIACEVLRHTGMQPKDFWMSHSDRIEILNAAADMKEEWYGCLKAATEERLSAVMLHAAAPAI